MGKKVQIREAVLWQSFASGSLVTLIHTEWVKEVDELAAAHACLHGAAPLCSLTVL